jgi:hypothetical protein
MTQLERICRECFWDYSISPEEIQKIISEDDLRQLFLEPLPDHKSTYMHRRVAVLKYLLLHEKVPVKGLEWKKI